MRPHLGKIRPIWAISTKNGQKCSRIGGKNSIISFLPRVPTPKRFSFQPPLLVLPRRAGRADAPTSARGARTASSSWHRAVSGRRSSDVKQVLLGVGECTRQQSIQTGLRRSSWHGTPPWMCSRHGRAGCTVAAQYPRRTNRESLVHALMQRGGFCKSNQLSFTCQQPAPKVIAASLIKLGGEARPSVPYSSVYAA